MHIIYFIVLYPIQLHTKASIVSNALVVYNTNRFIFSSGVVDEALAHQKIGALSTARWYTFASRLARYYVAGAHHETRSNVRRVLYYIVNVYVKVGSVEYFVKSMSC